MIAKIRSTAILDCLLVAVAVTTIAATAWPRGEPRQRVAIRHAEGTTTTVDLAVNDPQLRSIRNRMILWGRPCPTAELGFARWKRETARHYAALSIPVDQGQDAATAGGSRTRPESGSRPAVAAGRIGDVVDQSDGSIVQVEFTDRSSGESATTVGPATVRVANDQNLATQLADMITGNENSLELPTEAGSPPADQYWIDQAELADASASRARDRMLSLAAAAGPVPFAIGPLVDGPISLLGQIASVLLGLAAACLVAEWIHRAPPVRLADVDDDRRTTYGVRSESARVELPADWVRVIQPLQVRARRAAVAGVVATALLCSVI